MEVRGADEVICSCLKLELEPGYGMLDLWSPDAEQLVSGSRQRRITVT